MEFTLLGNAVIAAAAAWLMLRFESGRGNAGADSPALWEALLLAAAAALLAGRLVAMIGAGVAPWLHPADVLLVRAGVSTAGAAVVFVAVFTFLRRATPLSSADAVAASVLAALAGWHGGCVTRGACLGSASQLPWAIAQEGSAVTRHPVEWYAALLLLTAAVLLAAWRARRTLPLGMAASLALAVAGAVRLLTEPMRPSLSGGPVWLYGVAALAGLAGASVSWYRGRRDRLRSRRR